MRLILGIALLTSNIVWADSADYCKKEILQVGKIIGFKEPQAVYSLKDGTIFNNYEDFAKSESFRIFKAYEKITYEDNQIKEALEKVENKERELYAVLKSESEKQPKTQKEATAAPAKQDNLMLSGLYLRTIALKEGCINFQGKVCEEYDKSKDLLTKMSELKLKNINLRKSVNKYSVKAEKLSDELRVLEENYMKLNRRNFYAFDGTKARQIADAKEPKLLIFDKAATNANDVVNTNMAVKVMAEEKVRSLTSDLNYAKKAIASGSKDSTLAELITRYEKEIKEQQAKIDSSPKIQPSYIAVSHTWADSLYGKVFNNGSEHLLHFAPDSCRMLQVSWDEYDCQNDKDFCKKNQKALNDYIKDSYSEKKSWFGSSDKEKSNTKTGN